MTQTDAAALAAQAGASNAVSLDKLRELRASTVAQLQQVGISQERAEKMVTPLDKQIARAERGTAVSTYLAPAVPYDGEKVNDQFTEIQMENEDLLKEDGTIILMLRGGALRKLALSPNQVQHFSSQGIRRISQRASRGAGINIQTLNILEEPDGKTFRMHCAHEAELEKVEGKVWK